MATKPIPTRIPIDLIKKIDSAAKKLGTNRSAFIAFSAKSFAEHFEKHGEAMMPPDWKEIFKSLDGRCREQPVVYPELSQSPEMMNDLPPNGPHKKKGKK